jgi:hypothetical protein
LVARAGFSAGSIWIGLICVGVAGTGSMMAGATRVAAPPDGGWGG